MAEHLYFSHAPIIGIFNCMRQLPNGLSFAISWKQNVKCRLRYFTREIGQFQST